MERVAVLASGGLDSAVLLADLARDSTVFPLYVEFGLAWERHEKQALAAYLAALDRPNLQPLTLLEMPVRRLYGGGHWSLSGEDVPDYDAPIEADYLPGRNVFLVGLAAVWCSLNDVAKVALGSLVHNPYADATPRFFADYARLLSTALTHEIEVLVPYRGREKRDLVREHATLPLHLTLTCVAPKGGPEGSAGPLHCGACIKCRERHDAFVDAGVADPTRYAVALR